MNDVDDSGSVVNRISFLAGVKSRLIAIEAMDIVERIVAKNKTAINFKNFIKIHNITSETHINNFTTYS